METLATLKTVKKNVARFVDTQTLKYVDSLARGHSLIDGRRNNWLSTPQTAPRGTCESVDRGMLWRAVDLDDVAVGIEEEELRKTGGPVAADHDTHRVILRRVFAKTVGSQRGERAFEIISAESKMAIRAVDVAGPERTGRIKGQMHLQGTAGEPGAGALKGRPLNDPEAEQILIECERPRQVGDDEINMVERKPGHGRRR